MTVVRGMELGRELTSTLSQVNAQIAAIRTHCVDRGMDPYQLRDQNGAYALSPLLAAKAQCLHALVLVNQR